MKRVSVDGLCNTYIPQIRISDATLAAAIGRHMKLAYFRVCNVTFPIFFDVIPGEYHLETCRSPILLFADPLPTCHCSIPSSILSQERDIVLKLMPVSLQQWLFLGDLHPELPITELALRALNSSIPRFIQRLAWPLA